MDFLSNCKACTAVTKWITDSGCKENNQQVDEESAAPKLDRTGNECPLDTQELGAATWSLLHSMAAYYPNQPTSGQRCEIACFFETLAKFYPCSTCAQDFQADLKEMPPETESAEKLSHWLCKMHNRVNVKLGKPVFDCNRVMERWRDGWKDGSCD